MSIRREAVESFIVTFLVNRVKVAAEGFGRRQF
jgi:hypothetical protein